MKIEEYQDYLVLNTNETEVKTYIELRDQIYSLIKISQSALFIDEKYNTDPNLIDIYTLLSVAIELLPVDEFELLDRLHNEVRCKNDQIKNR